MSTESTASADSAGSSIEYSSSSSDTTFIDVSGGLLTEQTIQSLRQERFDNPAVTPETFVLPNEDPVTDAQLEEEIALIWEDLVERWDEVTQKGELFEMEISDARNKWILKLFQALDFEPVFQRAHLSVGDLEFDLSHKGWPDEDIADYGEMEDAQAPILHTAEPETDLDSKPQGRGSRSPHDTLQEFLNASRDQDWGIVTDGIHLRVLRDFYHTYTRGYVEFDLENIFESRNYQDFRALYRLCHASRFLPVDEDELDRSATDVLDEADEDEPDHSISTPLEMLYQTSLATGVKVGQDLQENVIRTIETLGNGLLNPEIREYLQEGGEEEAKEYYQEILLVVYRLLFLLYAEQRGMMPGRDSLYTEEYSITKLRERAERRHDTDDKEKDLWHGLQSTFKLVEEGNEELGVPCYDGMLFDSERLEYVSETECPNDALLRAVADLTLIEREGVLQRISYADLGVEEIGSVYESLLEFTPRLAKEYIDLDDREVTPGEFYLDDRGTERKETGSYYTDPGLVRELVESALKPVLEERLEAAEDSPEAKEEALLDISVCDPACGSAAFLVAANNFLARRLAQIRTGMEYPLEEDIRESRRSVLQHCIYAVDLNPMAVELAKVSLWINSAVEDKPLNFLDHHIKCGNSLLGANSELLQGNFPEDAYETSSGREWHVGNEVRKRVRQENKERNRASEDDCNLDQWATNRDEFIGLAEQIESIEEENTSDIAEKKELYQELQDTETYYREKLSYDIWTAAFYWPLDGSADEYPSPSTVEKIRRNPDPEDDDLQDLKERARRIADDKKFFHWELEFPEIFNGVQQGFDCILGNPPWEKVKLTEKEWFKGKHEKIANTNSKSHRTRLINELEEEDPQLYEAFREAKRDSENTSKFIRESGRFPLGGAGDTNTYPVFTELASLELLNPIGRMGMVVKTGIATDYYTQDLFAKFVESNRLVSLYDFVNKRNIFPDVALRERFSLLTTTGSKNTVDEFEFSFFNWTLEELNEPESKYTLRMSDIDQINPNTKNCPMFKSKKDRDVSLEVYKDTPILVKDSSNENPWGIAYNTMYHMANDSDIFADNTLENLRDQSLELGNDGIFRGNNEKYLPLWEGKFFQQFDHRFGTFEGISEEKRFGRRAGTNNGTEKEKKDPEYEIVPRYWVAQDDFEEKKTDLDWDEEWIFAFRETGGSASNSRTSIGTIIPMHPCAHKAPVLTFSSDELAEHGILFTTFFTSFVFDYALQQSLGGASVSYYILKQLPMPSPDSLNQMSVEGSEGTDSLRNFLLTRGTRLLWTSHSLDPLGEKVAGFDGPHTWDDEERNELRSEIDAVVAQAYGLSRDDFEYILESFDILKELEVEEYGEYKRKKHCLSAFDRLEVETPEG